MCAPEFRMLFMNYGKKKGRGPNLGPGPHLESSDLEFSPIRVDLREGSQLDEIRDGLKELKSSTPAASSWRTSPMG